MLFAFCWTHFTIISVTTGLIVILGSIIVTGFIGLYFWYLLFQISYSLSIYRGKIPEYFHFNSLWILYLATTKKMDSNYFFH